MSEVLGDFPLAGPALPALPTSGRPLAVFDVDGVLADVHHRLHHLEARPQRWERFFQAAGRDPVLVEGVERLRAALAADHDVVYLTGRPERTAGRSSWRPGCRTRRRCAASSRIGAVPES